MDKHRIAPLVFMDIVKVFIAEADAVRWFRSMADPDLGIIARQSSYQ